MKKTLSFLLSFVMLITLLPTFTASAFAAETEICNTDYALTDTIVLTYQPHDFVDCTENTNYCRFEIYYYDTDTTALKVLSQDVPFTSELKPLTVSFETANAGQYLATVRPYHKVNGFINWDGSSVRALHGNSLLGPFENTEVFNVHNYVKATTKATTAANGKIETKCTVCGAVKETSTIRKVSTVKLSTTKYTYDGKVKSPTLTVKDSAGKSLIKGTDYTVTTPTGRKYVGKYTYKITFKGKYSGTKTVSFTIVPKTTSISSLTAASKGFTAKWKKQATQTSGYQIQIATDSKFTKSVKNYTVSSNATVSKKITKLTGAKKYYVHVRTYKTVSGTKFYSSWSGSKYVTTKK